MIGVLRWIFFRMCVAACFALTVLALLLPYRARMTLSKCIAGMRDIVSYMTA